MKTKIIIFEGTKEDGIFSANRKFYKEDETDKEIYEKIKASRIKLGKKYNFSGLKMFQATQKMEDNSTYPDNKWVMIDESNMKKEDFFKEEICADILIISKKHKKVALAHRMADCPVLIAEDRKLGITAIAHCGIYHINRELPKYLIEALKENNSQEENIYLYIGSHIKKDNYIYDTYPIKATNKKVWEDAITKENEVYKIDLEKAILNQLKNYNLAEIKISDINTATDKRYASHYEAVHGKKEKLGQNIVGFYYK